MVELIHREITEQIIGAAFSVHGELGYGFLEKVYQRAMVVELNARGLVVLAEARLEVRYRSVIVGEYFADLLVNDAVVVELKVAPTYRADDEPQLLNELKACNKHVGILINFGREKVTFKRLVQ